MTEESPVWCVPLVFFFYSVGLFLVRFENTLTVVAAPEPSSLFLLGAGLVGVASVVRSRRKREQGTDGRAMTMNRPRLAGQA
jgi:hypothetical protein